MISARPEQIAPSPEFTGELKELLDLVGELNLLIADENLRLEGGLPASISQNVGRKAELGAKLDAWMGRIRSGDPVFVSADNAFHRELAEQLEVLKELMQENMTRLKHAMAVSRRRIEAIMSAVREQTKVEGGYTRMGARQQTEDPALSSRNQLA